MGKLTRHDMFWGCFWVAADEVEDGVVAGRLSGAVPDGTVRFRGLDDLVQKVDSAMNDAVFPQAAFSRRGFFERPGGAAVEFREKRRLIRGLADHQEYSQVCGRLATFFVRVIFRHNGSWQGFAICRLGRRLDQRGTLHFRSVLELTLAMREALGLTSEGADWDALRERAEQRERT